MAFRNYCTFEDRPDALIGIKLLALSLEKHCHDFCFWVVVRHFPPGLEVWLQRHAPRAKIQVLTPVHGTWNIKAEVLTYLLKTGLEEIVWIDSDIIILRDLEDLWSKAGGELVVAQEYDLPSVIHRPQHSAFGKPVRRTLPSAVNSCVLRFSRLHLPILEHWNQHLLNGSYRHEQARTFAERALGLRSDQDVLEYTLCTIDHPAADTRIYVQTGVEIIQDHGSTTYDLLHRLRNAVGWNRPFFVHALGAKPWEKSFARRDSAYVELAQVYSDHLDTPLLRKRSRAARLLFPSQTRAHLCGFPRCVAGKTVRFLTTGCFRRPINADSAGRILKN